MLVAPTAMAGIFSPQAESPNAKDIKFLYDMVALLGLIIFIAVEGLLFYSMWKFKARKGAVAAQIHGNTRLEIGWTVGAAVILVAITIVTFIKMPAIVNPAPSDIDANGRPVASSVQLASTDQPNPPRNSAVLNIKVDGQQYVWRYQYPGPKRVFAYEEMVVPVGMTVTLDISSDDVNHSFWIPALGGKMDAVPGYVNKLWFKTTKPKTYVGQCAELCGRNHANMYSRVRAVPFPEYKKWYDAQAAAIATANRDVVGQRKALEAQEGEQSVQAGGSAGGASDDQ